jgi:hypothetical protein
MHLIKVSVTAVGIVVLCGLLGECSRHGPALADQSSATMSAK